MDTKKILKLLPPNTYLKLYYDGSGSLTWMYTQEPVQDSAFEKHNMEEVLKYLSKRYGQRHEPNN